ncbi:MAG TPA: alpha/beta hydrolase [Tetrasphaera sp.]|uniref:Alpha/beta hydrolase n=1 Tax=Nostocoides vanveenii TaxID=330835 RepID=A0ABN2KGH4_9MICO|nr:alpha/beta hydrolase [Tetrasphaera sp.]HNQ06302.1 alpha/beta hydrolase [Tetrasphaera sp.]
MSIPHRTIGHGPKTVFLLHGWFGSADGWGSFPDYLDPEAATWVFTDNRGYGARMAEAGEFTLDEVADDVLALADELGADTFSLVGHSMGGAEVLRVLAKAPDRVERLVAITPVGAQPVPLDEAGHDLFFGAPDVREKRYGIVDFTTGNRLTPQFVNAIVDWSLVHSTVDGFRGAVVAWTSPDFLAEVEGKDLPVLVIPGEHDPALGEATVNQTWKPYFPNCSVEVMPNAGHYPMFETPVALATKINAFLG